MRDLLTTAELADAFGVSREAIRRWRNLGMPCAGQCVSYGPRGYGRPTYMYHLGPCRRWFYWFWVWNARLDGVRKDGNAKTAPDERQGPVR